MVYVAPPTDHVSDSSGLTFPLVRLGFDVCVQPIPPAKKKQDRASLWLFQAPDTPRIARFNDSHCLVSYGPCSARSFGAEADAAPTAPAPFGHPTRREPAWLIVVPSWRASALCWR